MASLYIYRCGPRNIAPALTDTPVSHLSAGEAFPAADTGTGSGERASSAVAVHPSPTSPDPRPVTDEGTGGGGVPLDRRAHRRRGPHRAAAPALAEGDVIRIRGRRGKRFVVHRAEGSTVDAWELDLGQTGGLYTFAAEDCVVDRKATAERMGPS